MWYWQGWQSNTQPDVDIIIGPGTGAIAAEGHILTAGGFGCTFISFVLNRLMMLHSGLTTMLAAALGQRGTLATTCTGSWHIGRMLQAADGFAMNLAFAGEMSL